MDATELISSIAPALASDTRIPAFLVIATTQTSARRFKQNTQYAIALRVCHMLARNPAAGPGRAGPTTEAHEGGVGESYQVPPTLAKKYGDLCSTPYGTQLAQLVEGNVFAPFVNAGPIPCGRS